MTRQRLPSGVPGLDPILNGGFYQSGVYILQGKPGAGKTILANQICFAHAARGGKAAYMTLLTESIARMFENLATMTFFDQDLTPDRIYYVSAFDVLENSGLQGLMQLLRGEIRSRSPSLLVLDGLVSASEKARNGTEFRKFIHELQGYASLFRCTIFLLGTTEAEDTVQIEHTMVEGVIDLADTLVQTESQRHLQVRKFRGGNYLSGRHAFTITETGAEVFPRLESIIDAAPIDIDRRPSLSTGIVGLDRLSDPRGLRSSSATLVVGPGGSGKTALGAHFLSGSSPEEPGLLFAFNEPTADVLANGDARSLGLSKLAARDALYTYWRPNLENIIDELGHRLIRMVNAHGVRRVFIDDLNALAGAAANPQRLDRFVAALTLELRRLGATSVFSVDSNGPDGRLPATVSSLPALFDNMIVLRRIETGEAVSRHLSIIKMRGCEIDGSLHRYVFGASGMVVGNAGSRGPGNGGGSSRRGANPVVATGNPSGSKPT